MKTLPCIFLVVCTALFSSNRDQDLKVIVEKSYLNEQFTPVLSMVAEQVIAESQKKLSEAILVETFRKEFSKEENLVKLFEPYAASFSDREIRELRTIIENPVYQKMMVEGHSIVLSHIETFRELFQEIAKRL